MTAILGISAFYHDSAAALVVDGQIVAAAQEERFTRRRHDAAFPTAAIEYCLSAAGLKAEQLDYVAYYEKPFNKFERLIESYAAYAPRGYRAFRLAMPSWLAQKLPLAREIRRGLGGHYRGPIVYLDHHQSHAASAFLPSPFEEAAILTVDGVGEWSTTCIGRGAGHRIDLEEEIRFPHSLGLLYSAFTYYLGFRVNSGEYKVMGLAPYGTPRYAEQIYAHLIDLKADGSYRLNMEYFDYARGLRMTSRKFQRLFGGPPRVPESELTERHLDLAASIQAVTNEAMLRLAQHAHVRTGLRQLALAGGVALNCVANSYLLEHGPFDRIWIQPAAGDAGGALGAALFVWHQLLEHPRMPNAQDAQHGSLLGPRFDDTEVRKLLDALGAAYMHTSVEEELLDFVAHRLAEQQIVGWFQGRMEFGPRALGARSILADPRDPDMRTRLNESTKFRESFRPFAPSVLAEEASKYFQLPRGADSPYMLLTGDVVQSQRVPRTQDDLESAYRGLERRKLNLSSVPAVTHVDYSARVQTVDAQQHPRFHRLLERWRELSGCPVLINTSFNVRGEPLVCSPADALGCFMASGIDILVIENFVLLKSQQPPQLAGRLKRSKFGQD
ncbi:MAG: carbamoyltransferase family protein [Aureliella sp.]